MVFDIADVTEIRGRIDNVITKVVNGGLREEKLFEDWTRGSSRKLFHLVTIKMYAPGKKEESNAHQIGRIHGTDDHKLSFGRSDSSPERPSSLRDPRWS